VLGGHRHEPLHSVSLFTQGYPAGDHGGIEVCIRVAPGRAALNLHKLSDGLITWTNNNVGSLSNIATELLSKFTKTGLRELDQAQPEAWANESYEIGARVAYENGSLRGRPKGSARDCRDVKAVIFLSRGYPGRAKLIADRRIYLAGYRLADLRRRLAIK
jgi:S1/P1 nuclease